MTSSNHNVQPQPQGGNAYSGANNNPNVASQLPQYNVAGNTTANTGYNKIDSSPMRSAEQLANAEQLAQPTQSMPIAQTVNPTPTPAPTDGGDNNSMAAGDPNTAQDVDTIEAEWVDRTRKVIAETREDPYAQAHEVAELMRDYIKKRYGKIVGKAPGSK